MDSGLLAEKIEDVLYSAIPFLDESNPDKVIDMAITFGLQLLATLVLFLIIRFKFWNVITGMMEKRKASVEEAISAKDEALIELENAKKDLNLNSIEKNIILRHMFPLTLMPPTKRESWIVTLSDKICSFMETFNIHNINRKRHKFIPKGEKE